MSEGRPRGVAGEERVLRHAHVLLTLQFAVFVTVLVGVAGAVAYGVLVSGQRADTGRTLARSIALGPAATPPGCVRVFAGNAHAPGGPVPAGMPVRSLYGSVPAPGDVHTERRRIGGAAYTVRTENRDGRVVQALFEERYHVQDQESLLAGLGWAEALALAVALLGGRWLAGRATRPLAEALRRQRDFVADASHELRAPLTRLHVRAQLLARRAGPSRDRDDLDRMVRGTRELGEVVEDLLLSTRAADRATAGRVDLGALADDVTAAEAARAEAKGLRLLVTREPGPYVVRGVPTALRRVLSALVDNAVGHTPPGGTVELALRRPDGRHVELAVTDSGVGFPPAAADRLFERFARGTEGEGRRFGLGLALVREVVSGHGGTVTASGRPGEGATFTLRLRADAHPGPPLAAPPAEPAAPAVP